MKKKNLGKNNEQTPTGISEKMREESLTETWEIFTREIRDKFLKEFSDNLNKLMKESECRGKNP